jgi:hypothetical protein
LVVFSETKKLDLENRFRRDADAYYVEAKRSVVSSVGSNEALTDSSDGRVNALLGSLGAMRAYRGISVKVCSMEDKFRYDDAGVPRVWGPGDDIDAVFRVAKEEVRWPQNWSSVCRESQDRKVAPRFLIESDAKHVDVGYSRKPRSLPRYN